MKNHPVLLELDQVRKSDVLQWGNKACILGELRANGFPVPDGFCTSVSAFRQAGTDLEISSTLEAALRQASERLFKNSQFLAVRSSATAEDLPGVSFAGLYKA